MANGAMSVPSSRIRPVSVPRTVRGASPAATRQRDVLLASEATSRTTTSPLPQTQNPAGAARRQQERDRRAQQPACSALAAGVRRMPEQGAPSGPGEAARLQGHGALLDLGDRAEQDGNCQGPGPAKTAPK